MEFLNAYALFAIFILILFFYIKPKNLPFSKEVAQRITLKGKISKKTKFFLLLFSFLLFLIALARPIINNGYITIKAPVQNLVIALDISKQMDKNDLYPNRFEFAKNKIKNLLKLLSSQNTAIILFDKHTYLISPPTNDYASLIYLLEHTDIKDLQRSEISDLQNLIISAKNLVKNPKIVIFSYQKFTPEKNEYLYLCSKEKFQSKNVFNAEYSNDNLKTLAKLLNANKQKDIKIKDKKELFYYPLILGILIMFFVIFYPLGRVK